MLHGQTAGSPQSNRAAGPPGMKKGLAFPPNLEKGKAEILKTLKTLQDPRTVVGGDGAVQALAQRGQAAHVAAIVQVLIREIIETHTPALVARRLAGPDWRALLCLPRERALKKRSKHTLVLGLGGRAG